MFRVNQRDSQPLDTYAWVLYKQALIEKDSKIKQEKFFIKNNG